jgi:hypothetical protein
MTFLQKQMLIKMARSEYTFLNGAEPNTAADTETWANVIIETTQDKGVFTSLLNASLVWHCGSGTDAVVGLTAVGFTIYEQLREV